MSSQQSILITHSMYSIISAITHGKELMANEGEGFYPFVKLNHLWGESSECAATVQQADIKRMRREKTV